MSDTIEARDAEDFIYEGFLKMGKILAEGKTVNIDIFNDLGKATQVVLKRKHMRMAQQRFRFDIEKANYILEGFNCKLIPSI